MTHPIEVLQDGALRLRPATPGDVPAIVAGLGDFEVAKWTAGIPHPFAEADVKLANEDGSPLWPDAGVIEWQGACVGTMRVDGRIGYWLARRAWGQGITTRAARLMLRAYFERTKDAGEVSACVFEGNPASVRVLEKLGFVRAEGACTGFCRARGEDLPQTNYRLTRDAWEGLA
ncbi:GNAT family N-acetyltransferase [Pseudaestuariivita atlantica]|uniref:N-acetyltransferase domain-containing protein n=1 Tax=Pseudaestuariivita atlantica TaxID=1317121 RepID=A0A0L1JTZ8_9RHOB|nr:GNAT family N-acetyltransferase [Pseudaestuariivita atlantica]KNG95249.1 hypothetical protein ATO11_01000 [Pseudaestuariivita atlantica]